MPPPDLRERLRRLRGEPTPAVRPDGPGLGERLRRLDPGGQRFASLRAPAPVAAMDEASLAASLGAAVLVPGLLVCERDWPLHRPHGRVAPAGALAALDELLPARAGGGEVASMVSDPEEWLFLDTETSGLAGGTGTWAFVCGLGQVRGDRLRLRQYLLTRLDAEPAMLAELGPVLAGAGLWISFNGKTFDLPLLATRLRLAGQPTPSAAAPHLDLLHPLRRAFARRWPDCRLASAEQRLLGLTRDADLPGAEAPQAWRDWLQRGDGGRLGAVLRHNRLDLITLAALMPALVAVQRDPAAHGANGLAIARHLLREGRPAAARAALAGVVPPDAATTLALVRLWQRAGDPTAALALAQRLPEGPERSRWCGRLRARLGA